MDHNYLANPSIDVKQLKINHLYLGNYNQNNGS